MTDYRLRFPFTWLLSGGSGCGKTTMTLNFLRFHKEMTTNPFCENIIYCYNEWQDGYEKISQEGIVTDWVQDLPPMSVIKDKISSFKDVGGSILVIDDFGSQITTAHGDLFTVLSHHNNCSVLILTQNLFEKNPVFRTISLNCTYITVFKNPRDNKQINIFASQVKRGKKPDYIVDAFHDTTEKPYTYLFFDNHQQTKEVDRVRTRILPHEMAIKPMSRFEPKNNGKAK